MSEILIIGYGNSLRGDDGLGWHAARWLQQSLGGELAQVIACHQLTPELAEPISRADLVLFIDAAWGEQVARLPPQPIEPHPVRSSFFHHLDPAGLLASARDLYGRAPCALLFAVASPYFDLSETLSPSARAALEQLVEEVQATIRRALTG